MASPLISNVISLMQSVIDVHLPVCEAFDNNQSHVRVKQDICFGRMII
jgi:hypothetical protein